MAAITKDLDGATASTGFCVLRPKKRELDSRYLYYWVQTKNFIREMMKNATGANYPAVSGRIIKTSKIPFPSYVEQKRIAAILDKADAIRRKRQQTIKLADDFLRATFLDMFGDPVTNSRGIKRENLCELTRFLSGGTPSKNEKSFWSGSFPWVSPKDVKTLEIEDSKDHINEIVLKKTSLKKVPVNSILIVVRGMILDHTVPVAITVKPVAINQDIKAIIPNADLVPKFLLWAIRIQHKYLLSKVSTAAHGTKRIEVDDLKNLKIPVPPKEEQIKFSNIVHLHSILTNKFQCSTRKNDALFNSLSKSAFQGELL